MEWVCPSMGAFIALYLYAGMVCTFLVSDGSERVLEIVLSILLWPVAGLYSAWKDHSQ